MPEVLQIVSTHLHRIFTKLSLLLLAQSKSSSNKEINLVRYGMSSRKEALLQTKKDKWNVPYSQFADGRILAR